jgi:large conductance mechanosensitive channel
VLSYGQFLNTIVTFVLVSLAVFSLVKQVNRLRRFHRHKATEPTEKVCVFCQSKISINATRCPNCTSHLADAQQV